MCTTALIISAAGTGCVNTAAACWCIKQRITSTCSTGGSTQILKKYLLTVLWNIMAGTTPSATHIAGPARTKINALFISI